MPTSLIRLAPTPFSSLPPHPALQDTAPAARPALRTFLHSVLTEASSLLSSSTPDIPDTFVRHRKPRSSPPSTAKVHLATRLVPADQLPPQPGTRVGVQRKDEFWVCRHSSHIDDDASGAGTASWDEFEHGLRGAERHSRNEMAYTPSVSRVETVLRWEDIQDVSVGDDGGGGSWSAVEMCVTVITHTFRPTLLIAPRTSPSPTPIPP
ncbi:hypothetical protein VTN02DRAFT_6741 [Thermoascus thermophilus]